MSEAEKSARRRLYEQLEAEASPRLSILNRVVVGFIIVSVSATILASEPLVRRDYGDLLFWLEIVATTFFIFEYIGRVWTCVEHPDNPGGWRGRLKYMLSPLAIIDLLAILPLFLAFLGSEGFLLRLFRLLRILRLARLGRFSRTITILSECLHERRYELWMSAMFALLLLLLSSTLLHIVEGGEQPDHFGSIPRAMWWSIATLTTVGYGDVYPVTVLGRLLAGATALSGIGLIAMPTGILAAAFSDALSRRRALDAEAAEAEAKAAKAEAEAEEAEAKAAEAEAKAAGTEDRADAAPG